MMVTQGAHEIVHACDVQRHTAQFLAQWAAGSEHGCEARAAVELGEAQCSSRRRIVCCGGDAGSTWSVTCWLECGIYTAYNIFPNTFGTTRVCASHSDKRYELIKPKFESRALKFGGWPTFERVIS
jgi:hypothetical protein